MTVLIVDFAIHNLDATHTHTLFATKWRLDQVFLAKHRLMMMMMMMMMMTMMMDRARSQNGMTLAADLWYQYRSLAEKPPTGRSVSKPHHYAFFRSSCMLPNISSLGNAPSFWPNHKGEHTGRTPLPKSLSAKHADFTGSSRDMQWHNNRHLGHFVACKLLQPNCCIPCLLPNALKCMEMHSGTSTCQQTWCHKRATIVLRTFPAPGLREMFIHWVSSFWEPGHRATLANPRAILRSLWHHL